MGGDVKMHFTRSSNVVVLASGVRLAHRRVVFGRGDLGDASGAGRRANSADGPNLNLSTPADAVLRNRLSVATAMRHRTRSYGAWSQPDAATAFTWVSFRAWASRSTLLGFATPPGWPVHAPGHAPPVAWL
jgi:hypothetical protein